MDGLHLYVQLLDRNKSAGTLVALGVGSFKRSFSEASIIYNPSDIYDGTFLTLCVP